MLLNIRVKAPWALASLAHHKTFFRGQKILIRKVSIMKISTFLLTSHVFGYDFKRHQRNRRMSEWRLARKSYKFDHPKISNKEAEETFRENLIEFEKEENPTTILNFWSGGLPRLQKISKHCGGCWLTNDKHVEYTADAIIFDHTRYRKNLEVETGVMPDFVNRNTDSQYWVFWPRESASKGIEKGTNHKLVKEIHDWDGAFNLTASCRLDSDAIRPYGNINLLVKNYVGKSQEEIIQNIMSKKQYNNGKHTAWMVSNCDKTNGAVARWELGQQLIRSGLKLDGFGSCFDNNINGNPWQAKDLETEGAIGKYKFYLGNLKKI